MITHAVGTRSLVYVEVAGSWARTIHANKQQIQKPVYFHHENGTWIKVLRKS